MCPILVKQDCETDVCTMNSFIHSGLRVKANTAEAVAKCVVDRMFPVVVPLVLEKTPESFYFEMSYVRFKACEQLL